MGAVRSISACANVHYFTNFKKTGAKLFAQKQKTTRLVVYLYICSYVGELDLISKYPCVSQAG